MLENELLCDSLKGRVRYFNTRYRHAHDGTGRICILVDDIEKISMPLETEYKISAEVYKRNDNTKSLKNRYDDVTEEFKENGIFQPYDFGRALDEFFINSIEESLKSQDYIVRLLAIFDRRVGKRTLEKLKPTVSELPEWLQYFYNLRLESEGLL
jgi:hypothetical protein